MIKVFGGTDMHFSPRGFYPKKGAIYGQKARESGLDIAKGMYSAVESLSAVTDSR